MVALVKVEVSLCDTVEIGMREWLFVLASELAVGAMSVDEVLNLGILVACFSRLVAEVLMLDFAPIDET